MDPYAIIDTSESPIVHVRVVAAPNDTNYPAYLDGLAEAFRGLDRFAMIFDTGDLSQFPAKYREMQVKWLKEHEAEFKGRWISSAFVIKSRLIRGVLMTMYWVKPPFFDNKVVAKADMAWTWTRDRLAADGISTSAAS